MSILIVIPARYASTRFPGKPLALISNKPMIQWVYENATKTGLDAVVATDDTRILNTVSGFGGIAVMTSPDHPSGTDRCREAAEKYMQSSGKKFTIVVNIQGDEPFIQPEQILALTDCFASPTVDVATLVTPVDYSAEFKQLQDANRVKVVTAKNGRALYFSRSVIPFNRNSPEENWLQEHPYFFHIGMYAFRLTVLQEITELPVSSLEQTERLEQLRWLENGYVIQTAVTHQHSIGVDTPEDLARLNAKLQTQA